MSETNIYFKRVVVGVQIFVFKELRLKISSQIITIAKIYFFLNTHLFIKFEQVSNKRHFDHTL